MFKGLSSPIGWSHATLGARETKECACCIDEICGAFRFFSKGSQIMCCCLQASAPASTLLVFRTASLLRSWDCDANAERTYGNNHIAQLNAKGRTTLHHHPRWKLMDVERLTMHSHCSDHLRDATHLSQHLTWTVLNLYVNMLKGFAAQRAHRSLRSETDRSLMSQLIKIHHKLQAQ